MKLKNNSKKRKKWLSSKKTGLPPGSLVYVGNREQEPTKITIFDFNASHFKELIGVTPKACIEHQKESTIAWYNIVGLGNSELIGRIGKKFGLHELLIEDILNTTGRPKLEQSEKHVFTILKMAWQEDEQLHFEHMALVMGQGWVLTFQEIEGDVFGKVRERLKIANSRLRSNQSDYLYYVLLDAIVDNYFIVLEHMGDRLEDFEDHLLDNYDHESFVKLQGYRKELIRLRRSVYPLREAISTLSKREHELFHSETEKYLRDLYDHTIQVIETVETFRDLITTMLDIYMSGISNRMNNIMKVLTIIATIFIPLTFIVGIYGMNFENMPELQWRYGYFYVMGFMAFLASGMLYLFNRKGWI